MSRDFTPRERYMVSMKMDPSYFMLNIKVKYGPADEEKSLFSEEEKQVILHYPIFGRAAPELLLSLKKEGEKDPEKMNVLLYTVEDDLKTYGDGIDEMKDEIDPTLKKWFDGKLDPSFYYREDNDRLFKDHLMEQFKVMHIENSIKKWYCYHYPDDELGSTIPDHLTFSSAYKALKNGTDIYSLLGSAADSIVRERIFEIIAVRQAADYNTIYQMWLDCDQEDLELDPAVIEQLMKKQYKATDIRWGIAKAPGETYQEVVEALGLPSEVELPNDVESNREITDYLTHKTGCYPIHFNVEKIEDKSKDEWERD